jgi:hypothetical protein
MIGRSAASAHTPFSPFARASGSRFDQIRVFIVDWHGAFADRAVAIPTVISKGDAQLLAS